MTKDQTSKKKANHKHTEGSDENDSKNTTKQKLEDLLINFIDDQFEEKNKILLNYPDNPFLLLFKTYYSLYPNNCENLLKLVQTISKYVKDCHKANYILERNSTKEFRNNLSNQRKEITALLYEFTPESTRAKQPSADFVRVCKTVPSTLKEIVDFIHSRIKFYRASTKDRYNLKDARWIREQAIQSFLDNELTMIQTRLKQVSKLFKIKQPIELKRKVLSPKIVGERSYYETAIRIISLLTDSDYTALHKIYYPKKKKT